MFSMRNLWAAGRKPYRHGNGSQRVNLALESLEDRFMPSANPIAAPQFNFSLPWTFNTVYSVYSIRKAYGFDQVNLNGAGQTIAIVDAFDAPTIATDLKAFDSANGLQDPPNFIEFKEHANISFQPAGNTSPSNGAGPAYNSDWENEISLDVEWAHAIAPGANILLVETLDNHMDHLLEGVDFARSFPGVSVVSMSWGSGEFAGETGFDSHFTTPQGHVPVTFVASTGDQGGAVQYPAVNPNVLAVGGTTLNVDDNSNYSSESAWSSGGGGVSTKEKEPFWQNASQAYGFRTVPDVAYDADPGTGFAVYCKSHDGFFSTPWFDEGGTSAGAPQWAALVALANQGRANAGKAPLAHTVQDLYQFSEQQDFHDVTDGNNGHWAHANYDLSTGLGTPRAPSLINDLINTERPIRVPPGGWHLWTGGKLPVIAVKRLAASPVLMASSAQAVETIAPTVEQETAARPLVHCENIAAHKPALSTLGKTQAHVASVPDAADLDESSWMRSWFTM
jgi:subtilase family serine protease